MPRYYSPRTVAWYNDKQGLYARFLGGDTVLANVTVPSVRAFIADLQGRTERHINNDRFKSKEGALSSSYIHGFARAFRAFARWLYDDGYTDANVLKNLKPPKVQQKVIEPLSDDEVSRLLKVFNRNNSYGARNYAAVITMLDCSLRASELRDLKLEDAPIEQGYSEILGKGNKERLVPIGQASQDALLRWPDRFLQRRGRTRNQFSAQVRGWWQVRLIQTVRGVPGTSSRSRGDTTVALDFASSSSQVQRSLYSGPEHTTSLGSACMGASTKASLLRPKQSPLPWAAPLRS